MHNIARDFRIFYILFRIFYKRPYAISIKLWVEEMRNLGDECPVLLFKEKNVHDDFGFLNIKDFAKQSIKFDCDKVCIDGTHGINSYDRQSHFVFQIEPMK